MSETINFSLTGGDQVAMKLRAVTEDVQLRGGRFALRKAAQFLAEKVRQNSARVDDPSTPSSIPANVDVRWNRKQYEASRRLGFRVGILGGAGGNQPSSELQGNPGGDTRHWRHLEFGTSKMPAQPFFRRALADNSAAVSAVFVNEYGKALSRAIKRASNT
jgi:HK97 gp10 family phage protein